MTGPSLRMLLRRPVSGMLIAGEVAFSVVLIVHLVIMQRTLRDGMLTDTRLQPETLFVVDADGDQVEARLRSLGAEVARVERAPHEITQLSMSVRAGDRDARAWFVSGTAELPGVLGLRIVDEGSPPADDLEPVLITESLARDLSIGVGQVIDAAPRPRRLRVTGVVADVLMASAWSLGARNAVFVTAQPAGRRAPYLARSARADFPIEARRALSQSRFVHIEPMTARLARSYANVRGILIVTVGVVLILMVAGTSGASTMVSLFITARTREIGLRRALGAQKGQVVAQLVVESLLISVAGAAGGVLLAFVVAGLTGTPLGALDPRLLAAAVAAVLSITVLSSWIPARRAARIPPAVAGKIL